MWTRRPSRPKPGASPAGCPKPAPPRGWASRAFDLLHKLVTAGAALATLVKVLFG